MKTSYIKPHLTYQEQIDLLKNRGLLIPNEAYAVTKLSHINYFRLSAYFRFFYSDDSIEGEHSFIKDATFEQSVRLYYFDKALRALIFNAIEKIEVYMRSQLAYHTSAEFGVFGYTDENIMHDTSKHQQIMENISREVERSSELFVKHFFTTYEGEHLPVWAMVEIVSFNTLSRLFSNLKEPQQRQIISPLGLPPFIIRNWLHTLTVIRNACAHHARVWNKTLGVKPTKPKKSTLFNDLANKKIFFVLTIIRYLLLKIDDDELNFVGDLKHLLDQYPEIDTNKMGFPADKHWQEIAIWKEQ